MGRALYELGALFACINALVWTVILVVPSGWHHSSGGYHVVELGLFLCTVRQNKGTKGLKDATLGSSGVGDLALVNFTTIEEMQKLQLERRLVVLRKKALQETLENTQRDWIWELKARACNITIGKEGKVEVQHWCRMWRNTVFASIIMVIFGLSTVLTSMIAAGFMYYYAEVNPSERARQWGKAFAVSSPLFSIVGLCAYFLETMDFGDTPLLADPVMNFGTAFWVACALVLSLCVPGVLQTISGQNKREFRFVETPPPNERRSSSRVDQCDGDLLVRSRSSDVTRSSSGALQNHSSGRSLCSNQGSIVMTMSLDGVQGPPGSPRNSHQQHRTSSGPSLTPPSSQAQSSYANLVRQDPKAFGSSGQAAASNSWMGHPSSQAPASNSWLGHPSSQAPASSSWLGPIPSSQAPASSSWLGPIPSSQAPASSSWLGPIPSSQVAASSQVPGSQYLQERQLGPPSWRGSNSFPASGQWDGQQPATGNNVRFAVPLAEETQMQWLTHQSDYRSHSPNPNGLGPAAW